MNVLMFVMMHASHFFFIVFSLLVILVFFFFFFDRSEARSQDLNRQFFQYSRLWWKEYVEIDPSFKERLVKIFAEDEWGGHRPVCSYVTPLSEFFFVIFFLSLLTAMFVERSSKLLNVSLCVQILLKLLGAYLFFLFFDTHTPHQNNKISQVLDVFLIHHDMQQDLLV